MGFVCFKLDQLLPWVGDLFGYWDNIRGKNVKMRDDLVLKFVFLVMS
jgi:hypothetical protein